MTTQTVLLVEDEPEIREMLSFALNRAGFNTLGAGSAEEALQLLDGPMPAVVVIDWMLPGASGIDLARRLRRDELFADLPMIMLTARGEEADKLKGFDVRSGRLPDETVFAARTHRADPRTAAALGRRGRRSTHHRPTHGGSEKPPPDVR